MTLSHDERRQLLEEIKEFKAWHYIGTQAAYNYLKGMQWFGQVRDEILRLEPKLVQREGMEVRKIASLLESMAKIFSAVLRLTASQLSTPEAISLWAFHEVRAPLFLGRGKHSDEVLSWNIPHAEWLASFLGMLPTQITGVEVITYLESWLRFGFRHGALRPTFAVTGEQVSFWRYRDEPKLRQLPNDVEFWGLVEWYCGARDVKVGKKTRLALKRSYREKDLATAHPIVQRFEVRQNRGWLRSLTEMARVHYSSDTLLIEGWLYDFELYERAEREYKLGLIEMERRLLLNEVHDFSEIYGGHATPQVFVEVLEQHLRNRIEEQREKLEAAQGLNSPFLEYAMRKLQRSRYLFRALNQNRKWLIEFLSR